MKIGIFSGAFDPIHSGHIGVMRTVLGDGLADSVVVVTEQAHRRKSILTEYEHRKAMIELAIDPIEEANFLELADEPRFSLDTTLPKIKEQRGENHSYALIMGVDVLEHVHEWGHGPQFQEILSSLSFLIALRTEDDGELAMQLSSQLELGDMQLFVSQSPGVSSSGIRESLARAETPDTIDPNVLQYIQDNNLYQ